jgi:hypothetical protein
MLEKLLEKVRSWQTRFSFGSTSAIIANLALIVGLDTENNAKVNIIIGILIIALANNLSESFGLHLIYQQSENVAPREILLSTFFNFLAGIFVSFTFILLLLILPLNMAVISSLIWGLGLLTVISYMAIRNRTAKPYLGVMVNLFIAVIVIFISNMVGDFLIAKMR